MRSTIYFARFCLFTTVMLGVIMFSSCKPRLLPSTNVPATRTNKAVVKFLEQYRAAVEKRSVEGILELVAKDFSDNMGTDNPAEHLDYLGLKQQLETVLPRIQDVRIGLFVQHIKKLEDKKYEVVFYFNKHILLEVPSGEKWASIKEVSRMVIRKRDDKDSPYEFEILSGV